MLPYLKQHFYEKHVSYEKRVTDVKLFKVSVKATLRRLGENLQDWSERGLNEAQTSQAIVLPVLQALGYDIFNPYEVVPQNANHGYYPDFTVNLADRIRFIIEVKALNKEFSAGDQAQSVNYVNAQGRRWAVLTNGKAWHFFDNQISKPAAEKLATTIDIQKPEAANYLAKLLARSAWEPENADDVLAIKVDEVASDIRKRTKLSEIAQKLERELLEGFTQDEAGLKKAIQLTLEPNEKELALESLLELSRKLLGAPGDTPPSPQPLSKESADLTEALKAGIASTKPLKRKGAPSDIKVWVGDDEVEASSWRDVTCGIAETLLMLDKEPLLKSTGLVNCDVNERTKANGDVYEVSAYRELSNGHFLFIHSSAKAHERQSRRLLELINAPARLMRVIYNNEEFYLP